MISLILNPSGVVPVENEAGDLAGVFAPFMGLPQGLKFVDRNVC